MDITLLPYRVSTERHQKRLRRKAADKQFLQLARTEATLAKRHRALPLVPLKEPYQKGWKRSFVLREDQKRSGSAGFYATLLQKINTVVYSADKQFRTKKRRKQRFAWQPHQQHLRAFTPAEWMHPKSNISAAEKSHFQLRYVWSAPRSEWYERYVFTEPWRYVLQVKPHIITHAKLHDHLLEQQLQQLSNRMDRHHLRPRINKLRGLTTTAHYRQTGGDPRYKCAFSKTPLHALLGACADETITTT